MEVYVIDGEENIGGGGHGGVGSYFSTKGKHETKVKVYTDPLQIRHLVFT